MVIHYRMFLIVFLFVSFLALGAAYSIEYIFGIEPCKLCLYQRMPYVIMIIIGLLGLFLSRYKRIICIVMLLISLSSCLIALFHISVEHNWLSYNSSCVSDNLASFHSLEEFKKHLKAKDVVSCGTPSFTFLSLSLATWNFVGSVLILIFAVFGMKNLMRVRWR